jgi:hypothetical protein
MLPAMGLPYRLVPTPGCIALAGLFALDALAPARWRWVVGVVHNRFLRPPRAPALRGSSKLKRTTLERAAATHTTGLQCDTPSP